MKWARPVFPEIPEKPYGISKLGKTDIADRNKFIQKIHFTCVEDLHKNKFREWLICKPKDWAIIDKFTADDRFSYEAYVGGFLAYYEIHISETKRRENRTVYFDWGVINKDVPLTIYLRPVNSPYYDDKGKPIKNTKKPSPLKWKSTAPGKSMRSPMAPPPAGLQTDPPIPPVPPPPPPRFNEQT